MIFAKEIDSLSKVTNKKKRKAQKSHEESIEESLEPHKKDINGNTKPETCWK